MGSFHPVLKGITKLTINEKEVSRLVRPPTKAEVRNDPIDILARGREEVDRFDALGLSRGMKGLNSYTSQPQILSASRLQGRFELA